MAEMNPTMPTLAAGRQFSQGAPTPAIRTSSLPTASSVQQAPQASRAPQQQSQQQHFQPQVIVAGAPMTTTQPTQNLQVGNQQIFNSTGLLSGPRLVVLHRHNGDFGFTLRHFIVYPPPEATTDPQTGRLAAAAGMPNFAQPMDTVFVKKVHPNSPAFLAGLQEGDRLLAVNGLSVTSIPYAQVVATIQQTPKTLTLQVVPKNYDLLQTYFSETAYNPETNQRPQPQQLFVPKVCSTPNPRIGCGGGVKRVLTDVQEKQESLYSTLQEIVENVAPPTPMVAAAAINKVIYAEVPKTRQQPLVAPVEAPTMVGLQQQQLHYHQQQQRSKPVVFDFDPIKQQHYFAQQQQQQQQKLLQHSKDNDSISSYDSVKSVATLSANDILMGSGGDSAIMSRLRKSFEQKEEFLRRPAPVPPQPQASFDVQQREFYGRPNRLQKSVWPPPPAPGQQQQQHLQQQHLQQQQPHPTTTTTMPVINTTDLEPVAKIPSKMSSGTQTTSIPTKPAPIATSNNSSLAAVSREQHTSHLSAIREQFFSGVNGLNYQQQQQQQPQQQQPQQYQLQQQQQAHQQPHQDEVWVPPRSAPASLAVQRDQLHQNQLSGSQSTLPLLSTHSMHVVSEKAKLFESGRPLSPDGIDRAELYKSELSRINTKQVVQNVAVRRKEFELKAESSGWRRSTEEKARSVSSDSESRRTPVRVRSLSVESTTIRDPTAVYASNSDNHNHLLTSEGGPGGPPSGPCSLLRQRPVRENSYRNAVRNSTDSGPVVLRQKQQQNSSQLAIEEDERKTRRISYLRATAHDNLFQMESDPSDSSPMSLPPDTPDTEPEPIDHQQQQQQQRQGGGVGDNLLSQLQQQPQHRFHQQQQQLPQQLKSAYRPWRRPRFTTDIQPLRRLFDESAPLINLPPILEQSQLSPQPIIVAGSVVDLTKLVRSPEASDDEESMFHGGRPGVPLAATPTPPPLSLTSSSSSSTIGLGRSMAVKKRSSSLTAAMLSSQLGVGHLKDLHMITSTSASGVITRSYFFAQSHGTKSKALAHFRDSPADPAAAVVREGELNVKVTLIDGKRSQDRSWRTVHAELRGNRLKLTLLRDGKSSSNQSPEPSGIIDLTNFHVAEGNYTKRKNVFKLTTVSYQPSSAQSHQHLAVHQTQSGGGGGHQQHTTSASSGATSLYKGYERELLLQADSQHDMRLWMDSLKTVCRSSQYSNSIDYINNLGGQQAEPQRVAALTSVQSASNDEFSPILSTKSHRKYTLGSRSPSGQSPVTKSRKTPQQNSAAVPTPSSSVATSNHHAHGHHHSGKESSDKETGSPKSKTWKGIVARQFRKMQGQPGSPGIQNQEMVLPDGASINVPLPLCPPSDENPYVPLLLAKCTGIVESKGLGVVGIYRIPGNTAAISQLTEQVNRGMDEVTLRDPRWDDVNVVSSLLKSFIRNLPDPLLPNEMYHSFIEADKQSGQQRLIELKQLLNKIPTYNHETLKHLIRHLYAVSTNALVNLMDPRNLAIVFGPSVVRSANESLETAVKDMKHQCQIVEVLINHYQYFFEDDLLPEKMSSTTVDSGLDAPSTNLLLDNVSKIEPFKESSKESSSHFVAQIVQAANRKIRRTTQRKSTMSSTTPDTLSLDSTTSAESKEQSSRTSHRYLHPNSAALGTGAGGGGGASSGIGSMTNAAVAAAANAPQLDHHQVGPGGVGGGPVVHSDDSQKENLVHHHHYHHYHHHHGGGGGNRHHSVQSNDDNSSVLNRSSEEDSNDSAFADNGSMSLKTVTLTLDHKLRSLRNSSIDSDRDVAETTLESDCDNSSSCYSANAGTVAVTTTGTPTRRSVHHSRPLTLGENIPYADESPERPLIQSRSKPLRQLSNTNGNFPKSSDLSNSNSSLFNNNTSSVGSSPTGGNGAGVLNGSVKSAHSDKSIDSSSGGGGMMTTTVTANSSGNTTNDSCVTLVNEEEDGDDEEDKVNNISLSSDDTDTSTTSNPREKLTAATYRIDTEVLKKMNRILTNLERKANNLERKFNLNRSLSLNYKNHKNLECCCGHTVANSGAIPSAQCCNNNNNNNNMHNQQNNNNSVSVHNSLNVRSRLSLTKDEKTDKNINRRRQIHDVSQTAPVSGEGVCCGAEHHQHHTSQQQQHQQQQGPQIILTPTPVNPQPNGGGGGGGRHRRQVGSRSIRRRHTVGGTHDYCSNKIVNNHGHNGMQCQQQQQQHGSGGRGLAGGCTAVVQQGVCGGEEK
ncbi:uncharacterized protein LOC129762815 isoform X4 [Toxorhynchites rutilus septentrionalis]|uniref:uncharacterized protein LOC129762815 isoform X4 n=1 Tax=Toxorhynchites rutilus septentrionalis TaxID=329112 RepID=UPI00247A67DB|nr:uncharacterized protein LOC129762815 isoform X4 [Toxorhynchites rutilus septentrionalis]